MYRISRRQLFQFAGSALATLGISQLNVQQQGDRYGRVLAKSTPRKLALLIGINQYQKLPLEGCINDVQLQRHLLIHRFGFNPKDIYTLTDEKATRQGILDAFDEYLIKQAKPRDVVVYHYSGHGSLVRDPDPIITDIKNENSGLNGTFVPADSLLPEGYPEQGGVVKDIMGHTLFLLMSAVKSENFTAVLDSCFSGAATRKFRVRARQGGKKIEISPLEKAYQEQWLSRLKLSREAFVQKYRAGVAKGVVLAATAPNQFAVDAQLNGFKAGAFTYSLTRYLWQQTSTVDQAMTSVVQQIPEWFEQTPRYEVKANSEYEKSSPYFINSPRPTADAVVTEVKGSQARLWLGGIDLATIAQGTVFTVVGDKKGTSGRLMLQSREGLLGVATVEGVVEPGALLQKVV